MSPCGIFRTFGTLQSSGRLCWYGDLVANVWRFPLSLLWHAPWCVHARGSSLCDSSKSVCWLSIMCRYWTLPLTSALSTPITSLPERTHTAHKSQTNVWTGIGEKKLSRNGCLETDQVWLQYTGSPVDGSIRLNIYYRCSWLDFETSVTTEITQKHKDSPGWSLWQWRIILTASAIICCGFKWKKIGHQTGEINMQDLQLHSSKLKPDLLYL